MTFTFEGKEYEFRGEYRHARKGDYYLNEFGTLGLIRTEYPSEYIHAIVHPVEPEKVPNIIVKEN